MVASHSACIKKAGVKFHLGAWPTQELAAEAYDKAALCINVLPPTPLNMTHIRLVPLLQGEKKFSGMTHLNEPRASSKGHVS